MTAQHDIRLFLADVDGALVTKDKVLTEAAKAAVRDLDQAGIAFAITSGRPPRGMSMLIEPLALRTAIAGFNGGVLVNPDLSVIESHTLDPAAAKQTIDLILDRGLDAWVYTETEWLIRDKDAPHVAREAWTVKFDAKVVASFTTAHLAHACSALAAILSRRDSPASQQGDGRRNPVEAFEHPARADRHHGRHAERRPHVPQERLLNRHGQCKRRGEGAGERGDRQQRE